MSVKKTNLSISLAEVCGSEVRKERKKDKFKSIASLAEVCGSEVRSIIKLLDVMTEVCENQKNEEFSELFEQCHKSRQLAYTLAGALGTISFTASEDRDK